MDKFEKVVAEMRAVGEVLVKHSFPLMPGDAEEDISILKTREMLIDGYEVTIYYSKSEYPSHILETFQIFGQRVPFLPFHMVTKIARKFLGESHLSLVEVYVNNKKLYIWTKTSNKEGTSKPTLEEAAIPAEHEGFKFHRLNPRQVNFL